MATTAKGTPYVESSDLVANYPAVSLALAEHIDDIGGKVLQVVEATYSTQTSTTSTSYVTTGLSATITPATISNKILIIHTGGAGGGGTPGFSTFTLFRGTISGTDLSGGSGFITVYDPSGNFDATVSITKLDSPATISAQTYTVGMKSPSGATTTYAQRRDTTSSIILMEVAA